jgi:hypothetical protein
LVGGGWTSSRFLAAPLFLSRSENKDSQNLLPLSFFVSHTVKTFLNKRLFLFCDNCDSAHSLKYLEETGLKALALVSKSFNLFEIGLHLLLCRVTKV